MGVLLYFMYSIHGVKVVVLPGASQRLSALVFTILGVWTCVPYKIVIGKCKVQTPPKTVYQANVPLGAPSA